MSRIELREYLIRTKEMECDCVCRWPLDRGDTAIQVILVDEGIETVVSSGYCCRGCAEKAMSIEAA
jgi:hypothetical protein